MDKIQSLLKSSWKCSLPTKLRNRDVDWFLQFCPSTSQGLVVEGKEGIFQKKKKKKKRVILSVIKMYCSCIQPDFQSGEESESFFTLFSSQHAHTNQHGAQSIVVAGETSFDCYCIPLLQVCFQVLRNVPLKCSHCSLATHLLGKLDTIQCALQNVWP